MSYKPATTHSTHKLTPFVCRDGDEYIVGVVAYRVSDGVEQEWYVEGRSVQGDTLTTNPGRAKGYRYVGRALGVASLIPKCVAI